MIRLGLPTGPIDVLCLGAHPDDVEIGCGGALLQLADRPGTTVRAVLLTGSDERTSEAAAALDAFAPGATLQSFGLPDGRLPAHWGAVKEALEHVAATCRPDLVLAPRTDDAHQDHRLVGELVRTVWRDALVLHYEIPKWDGDTGAPTYFVPLTEGQARMKAKLLNAHYPSQATQDDACSSASCACVAWRPERRTQKASTARRRCCTSRTAATACDPGRPAQWCRPTTNPLNTRRWST